VIYVEPCDSQNGKPYIVLFGAPKHFTSTRLSPV
jgi:hypothetical protein